jgi:hypothetical protein
MDDYSVFYYTYSTISQTLSGAFALLTAVAIHQIQAIQAKIDFGRNKVTIGHTTDPQEMARREHATYGIHEDRLKAMQEVFYRALKWTGGVVIACFVLMPLTVKGGPLGNVYVAWIFLTITVVAAIWTLWTFKPLMKAMMAMK